MITITLIIIIIIIISIQEDKKKNKNLKTNYEINNNQEKTQTNNTRIEENLNNDYYKKEYLITKTERELYYLLKEITQKNNLEIFTQVSLYEIVKIKNNNNYNKNFNKISRKTIDFIITDKNTKIKLCIELDDYTHNKPKRIERDIFVNNLFKEINLPLLRIQANNYYNKEILEKIIKTKIGLE